MQNLITHQEFAEYKDIGKKLDEKKINECIADAQSVDLYDLLADFIYDVVENREEPNYADLMNGSTYTVNGLKYSQIGLKSLLADLVYPRYMYKVNVNLTPFGAVSKFSDNSEPIDRNVLKDIAKQSQIDADIKFKSIKRYLQANKELFPRYQCGNNPNIHTNSPRFSKL